MSVRRRPFPEVLDALLTGIAGGVAAESHPFPPPGGDDPPRHALQRPPAAAIVSVYGTLAGEAHRFRERDDYTLSADGTTLTWTQRGGRPDDGTLVDVSYSTAAAAAVLTDLSAGSVVRTLAETVAVELARLYATLDEVYRAGFVDSASGGALDRVVELLDVVRVRAGRATGDLEFTRVPGTPGALPILVGTRVRDVTGTVEYETTATVTMADGQDVIRVLARDLEPNEPVPAGTLTVMSTPQAGIAGVTNPRPTTRSAQDETDDQLRDRAKNALQGSARATPAALAAAIAGQGIGAEVIEPFGADHVLTGRPGLVTVRPRVDTLPPDLQQRVLQAIEDTRPAGVLVTLEPGRRPGRLDLQLRVDSRPGLLAEELTAAQAAIRRGLAGLVAGLPAGADVSLNRIAALALSVPGVQDVNVLAAVMTPAAGPPADVIDRDAGLLRLGGQPVVLGTVGIADPALPAELDLTVVTVGAATAPAEDAVRRAATGFLAALNQANATAPAPRPARVLGHAALVTALALPAGEHRVTVGVTPPGGVSAVLSQPADSYPLQPFERLALAGVTLTAAAQ